MCWNNDSSYSFHESSATQTHRFLRSPNHIGFSLPSISSPECLFCLTAEYVNIHKQRPDDPFPVFCVCLAFVHLASQKYINSKNSLVFQVMIRRLSFPV